MEDPTQIAAGLAGSAVDTLDQAATSVESGEQVSLEQAMQAVANQGGDTTIAQHALNALGGFVTGFATSYTGKDYLSPYLQSQVERRKESRARIQIFSKMAMAVNKDPDAEALFVKMLGNPSQEDLPKVLASIDSQMGEMLFDEHLRERASKGKEEDRLQATQDMVLTRSAEAQAFGFKMPGPDATREENLAFVSKVDRQRDENGKLPQASAARLQSLATTVAAMRPEQMTDDEWAQKGPGLLAPFVGKPDEAAGHATLAAYSAGRKADRRELLERQAEEILQNMAMPEGKTYADLTEAQRTKVLAIVDVEYNSMLELTDRDNLDLVKLLDRKLLDIKPEYATTDKSAEQLLNSGAATLLTDLRNVKSHPLYAQAQQLIGGKERIYQGLGTVNAGLSALGIAGVELKHLSLGSLLNPNGEIVLDVNSSRGQEIQQELNALIRQPGRGTVDTASLIEFASELGFSASSFVGPVGVAEAVRENATAGQPSPNATKQAVTVTPDFAAMSSNATGDKLTLVKVDLPSPLDLNPAEAQRLADYKVRGSGTLDSLATTDYEELLRRDTAARSPIRAVNLQNMRAIPGTLLSGNKTLERALGGMVSNKQTSSGMTAVDTTTLAGKLSGTLENDTEAQLTAFIGWMGTSMAANQSTEGSRLDSPTPERLLATYDGLRTSLDGQAEAMHDLIVAKRLKESQARTRAAFESRVVGATGSVETQADFAPKEVTGLDILTALTGQVYNGNTIEFSVEDASGVRTIRKIKINDLDPESLESVAAMFQMFNNIG